jgi:ribosomal protein S18 acetylase RimI-like enzyme
MKIRTVKNDFDVDFIEQIIELDRANMALILAAAGIEFPEERRRKGFEKNPTFIVAETARKIVGYLEYTRSSTDKDRIYISSIQIAEKFRRSKLILRLIDKFIEIIEREDFKEFETNVQKNNPAAVKLYKKIGFEFAENPHNPASWLLKADRKILKTSPVAALLERWRKQKI